MDYSEFLRDKLDYGIDNGFEPLWMPSFLFDFQTFLVDWAIRKGRGAIFADCGMGKTPMSLVWSQNVLMKTNKPVLNLTPLAVSGQTVEEAEKFGIDASRAVTTNIPKNIQVTNYEQLHHYDPADYGGVYCDESSMMKNFKSKRKGIVTEFLRTIPYRLFGTATAAPNDWIELGTSSEALGYMGYQDMLTEFFTHRQSYREGRRDKYYIKGWATKGPFWQWVASWARAARRPSDLGFDDTDFILPPLIENDTKVRAENPTPGMLWDMPARNWAEERETIRRTTQERCEAAAERVANNGSVSMVWCNLNQEGDLLEKLIPGSVQIAGKDSERKREEAVHWFKHGSDEQRVLISKPKILGYGVNFQHCNHATCFPTHSYEQYYQLVRRLWRFGQERQVKIDRIYTNGGSRILANLQRKSDQADVMFTDLVKWMGKELHIQKDYREREVTTPQWMR